MTPTVVSDLNGANRQFTLTCISTCGPATTVIWIRDTKIITGTNATVLNDGVTAQYTHKLTVTERVEIGLYTCSYCVLIWGFSTAQYTRSDCPTVPISSGQYRFEALCPESR